MRRRTHTQTHTLTHTCSRRPRSRAIHTPPFSQYDHTQSPSTFALYESCSCRLLRLGPPWLGLAWCCCWFWFRFVSIHDFRTNSKRSPLAKTSVLPFFVELLHTLKVWCGWRGRVRLQVEHGTAEHRTHCLAGLCVRKVAWPQDIL